MSRTQEIHDRKVEQVAAAYRAQGYQVEHEPSDPALRAVLADYQPDLIASRGDEHIAVEVRAGAERLSPERFQEIAERLRALPGWRFLLMPANTDAENEEIDAAARVITSEALRDRLERARALLAAGEKEAAFLLSWSVLEGLVRRRLEEQGSPLDRLAITALLKHLYSQGEISAEQLEQVLALHETRNRLVHGLQPTEAQDLQTQAERLLMIVENLEQAVL